MGDYVYRLFYIERGSTTWQHEDFYERTARQAYYVDNHDNMVMISFAEGDEDFLPDEPNPHDAERIE